MLRVIAQRQQRSPAQAVQRKPFQFQFIHDRLKVENEMVLRRQGGIAVRQPCTAHIEAHQRMAPRQRFINFGEGSLDQIGFEVRYKLRGNDDGWTISHRRISDSHAIGSAAKANVLRCRCRAL